VKNYYIVGGIDTYFLFCNKELIDTYFTIRKAKEEMAILVDKDKTEKKAKLYEILAQDCSIEKKLEQVANMLL